MAQDAPSTAVPCRWSILYAIDREGSEAIAQYKEAAEPLHKPGLRTTATSGHL